jgi:hypothetical protein
MEEWLLASDQVCQALELPRIPNHTTVQRTYKKLHMLDFEKMKDQLLDENDVDEEGVASDCTGFSPGQASLYYQTRTGRIYQRWKTETVNSVIKRKFGDTIRSRKRSLQRREPIIKGLVYNLHR